MNLASWLKRRLRVLFRREGVESDLSDEIRLHLDMETEELVRQGRSRDEARREARLLLGGVEQTKEAVRDTRPFRWLDGLGLDLRLGLRMLHKSWGLTLVGGLAMVVVIGLCTTGFVILNAVTGSELPIEEGDRVVALRAREPLTMEMVTAVAHFESWRSSMRSVEDLAAFTTIERDFTTDDGLTARVSVARMTASGFRVARVQPQVGRALLDEDERAGAQPVVVIGYEIWQTRFAGDPAAIGRTVRLGGLEHVVVGVMPQGFAFPVNHRAWTPFVSRNMRDGVTVFGRLAPGIALERAAAELASIGAERLDASRGAAEPLLARLTRFGVPFQDPKPDAWVFRSIPLLFALLLIPPCANIAILLYARNVTRTEEFAARFVLGAGRGRIVGQLLVEASVLAACAGGVALALTDWLLGWIRRYGEQDSELNNAVAYWIWMRLNLSFESVLYAGGLALFAAMVAGGLPALRATGWIAQAGFQGLGSRTGGPRLGRTWTALVVVQVALSMAVLPVAIDQVWVSLKAVIVGPGFAAGEYLTAQLSMDDPRSPARFRDLQAELVRQLQAEAGVLGAATSTAIAEAEPIAAVETDLPGQERFAARSNAIGETFLGVFTAPLLTGRRFEPADFNPGRPTVIVTRTFAERLPAGVNPLGVRVRNAASSDSEPGPWFEIVGVVDEIAASSRMPAVYRTLQPGTFEGERNRNASLALRVGPSIPRGLAARLPELATALDPGLRVDQLRRLDSVYQEAQRTETIGVLALTAVLGIVLLFSAAGIYTLASFAVAQRRREIAIRAAIGAQPTRLVADILGRTLVPVIAGAAAGALLAIFLDAQVENDFSAIGLTATAAFMLAIGVLAVVGPARRALRVDAAEALRDG